MTTNYEYKVGGSLGENAPSYVVRQADFDLYHSLKAGEFCYIFNSRQMGKTSLIVRTMNKLQAEGFACTSLDFSVRGSQDIKSEQWYAGIVYKLTVNFKLGNPSDILRGWWVERGAITPVERLEEFIETALLASIKSKIVIFIDEIDSVLSLGFSTDDFFALIRSCYEKRNFNTEYGRLTFALVGVVTPSDLIGDKRRTPFNIGKAIQLEGFKDSEIQPLAKGFEGKVENPLVLMQEVLNWTGGQPFLTQKICQLIIQKLPQIPTQVETWDYASSLVDAIIRSKIITNWEAADEPEHIKTIRDRMLLGEQVAGRFLGWYQQILLSGYIHADESIEQTRFRLTGLVVKQQNELKVYNKIYESVLNIYWVKKELNKLRPYSENFQAWVDSNYQDESRLLRGQALQEALQWASEKSLGNEDSRYLAASGELEKRELEAALAVQKEESRILAAANDTLNKAQQKSKRQIQFGSAFLSISIVGAIVASIFAGNAHKELQNSLTSIRLEQDGINFLRQINPRNNIDDLLLAMRNGRKLKSLVKHSQSLVDYPAYSPVFSLQAILSNIHQKNRLEGHLDEVNTVVYSPDGKTLASTSNDKTIKLWNGSTGKLLTDFIGHDNTVNSVVYSPDGKTLASASWDKTIRFWDVQTGKQIDIITGHEAEIMSVAYSPDGKTLASAGRDNNIKLWDVATKKLISTLTGHIKEVNSVVYSSDGKTLASASGDGTIKLWDIATAKVVTTLTGHEAPVITIVYSPDGKTLASASWDKTVKLWDAQTGKVINTLNKHQDKVHSVVYSPDGRTLASASFDKTIKLWNGATGQYIYTLTGHEEGVKSVIYSLDGKTLASASFDKTIKLWDVTAVEKPNSTLSGHKEQVRSVVYSPDGKTLASASWDKSIKLWNVATGKVISTFTGDQDRVYSVVYSPDGKTLATTNLDKSVKLWEVATGKVISNLKGHTDQVRSVVYSPDGKTLASTSHDKTIRVWDIATGKEILPPLTGHEGWVYSVVYSPDGKTLASASADRTIKLWDVATRKPLATLTGHQGDVRSVVYSPDGKTLASASADKTIKLWDAAERKLLTTLDGYSEGFESVVYSPDGKMLAFASGDRTIKLWNLTTKKPLTTLIGHTDAVNSVVFSPDGKTLASASNDNTIKLWSLDLDDLLVRGCDYLKEYFASGDKERKELRKELCPDK